MKDPAFLFYPEKFLTGVSDLTMEERGQYITLLCLQHQKGILSDKTIRLNVGSVSVDVMKKFLKDADGNYFNEKLREEIEKRSKFAESRKENGKKGGRKKASEEPYAKPYAKASENLPINININKDYNLEKDKGGLGEKEKTNLPARMNAELTIQMSVTDNNRAHDVIDMQNNLPRGSGKKMAEIFLSMLDATGELQKHNPDDMGKYFINWANYHAKRLRPMLENAGNKSEVVSTYFEKTTGKQTPDEMLKSLHAYLK